jgi:hypothetical protein
MRDVTTSYTAAGLVTIALALVLVILLSVIGYRWWKNSRITPAERERRRCDRLVAIGKMGDGALVEIHDSVVFYVYAVRGVEYTASQDLSLLGRSPAEINTVRSLSVKYDPRNPADSIVVTP